MGNEFRFEDKTDYSKIQNAIIDIDILVGYPDGLPFKEGFDLPELARTLTYGNDRIPARPFIEEGILEGKEGVKRSIGKLFEASAKGEDLKVPANRVGVMAVGAVQQFVRGGYYQGAVPNAPSTIEAKGSDVPLIDNAYMINSLTHLVKGVK